MKKKGERLASKARTEAFKLVSEMEIDIDGLRLPLNEILEEEVRARVKKIRVDLRNLEARKRRNQRRLQRSAIELAGLTARNPT